MKLRPYQSLALAAIEEAHKVVRSTIAILATGLGKTVLFSHLAHGATDGRVLIIAHRNELIEQAAAKVKAVTGEEPEIEKAERRAYSDHEHPFAGKYVVASIQTLASGPKDKRRMCRFDPNTFSHVIIDEAHRAEADTYREVFSWFGQNPRLRFTGVTATGDRADKQGLGCVFESVCFNMELPDAIREGWLVPVKQVSVVVEGLDFSKCRTTGGDLNAEDLEAAMAFETVLHPIAHATIELAAGLPQGSLKEIKDADDRSERLAAMMAGRKMKQTLVFAASVALAIRLAEIFNRWMMDVAKCVHGETETEERAKAVNGFRNGDYPIFVNVGIATEGFDAPATEIIVMGRPTKSRGLATQMIGRGTRPAESVASRLGEFEQTADRVAAIRDSDKTGCVVLDFVGNCGRHRLVSAVDVLAGEECDPLVLDRATEIVRSGEQNNVQEAIEQAEIEEEARREAAREQAEARAEEIEAAEIHAMIGRSTVVAVADYQTETVGNVTAEDGDAPQYALYQRDEAPISKGGATDNQINTLVKYDVKRATAQSYSKKQASAVIGDLMKRRCSTAQAFRLKKEGYTDAQIKSMNTQEASAAIDAALKARVA